MIEQATSVWYLVHPNGKVQLAHVGISEQAAWLTLIASSAPHISIEEIPARVARWKEDGWEAKPHDIFPSSGEPSVRVEWLKKGDTEEEE